MFADPRLIAAAMGGLVASLILAAAFESFRRVAVLTSCIGAMCFFELVPIPPEQSVAEWQWLPQSWVHLSDGFPVTIEFAQAVSSPLKLLLLGLFVCWATFGFVIHSSGPRTLLSWLGLQVVVVLAMTATDLIIVLLCWLMIEEFVEHIAAQSGRERIGCVPPLRVSSFVLLIALALLQIRYHSTSISTLLTTALHDTRLDADIARDGLATVLAFGIVMRCGLFPFSLWLKRLLASGSPLCLPLTAAVIAPAFALGVRMIPLWQATTETPRLFFVMGTIGVVPLALTAFVSRKAVERCCLMSVALCGVALMRLAALSGFALLFATGVVAVGLPVLAIIVLRQARNESGTATDSNAVEEVTGSGAVSSLRRLPLHWWYLEEVAHWCCVLPIRWMATFIEFVDRVVFCGSKEGVWAGHVRNFADMLDAIRLGRARYYALAVIWAAVGLGAVAIFGR